MTQYPATMPEETRTQIEHLWTEGLSRSEIVTKLGLSYWAVTTTVKRFPNNGTTGKRHEKQHDPYPWPRNGNMDSDQISECYAGQTYDDVKLVSHSLIPMDGNRLKFAARVRNVSFGVSAY